jgi:hypothetical protein
MLPSSIEIFKRNSNRETLIYNGKDKQENGSATKPGFPLSSL